MGTNFIPGLSIRRVLLSVCVFLCSVLLFSLERALDFPILSRMDLNQSKQIAEAFTTHFYNAFDTNRSTLADLYCEASLLQFESSPVVIGKDEIVKKLVSLPMQTVKHIITTTDGQPTIDNGILIHVLGQLKADEDQPHSFSEMFHLKPNGSSYIILNQIFRLGVHNG